MNNYDHNMNPQTKFSDILNKFFVKFSVGL